MDIDINALAARMLADYDAHDPGTVFREGLRLSIPEAWDLQSAVTALREQRGERVIGYKIGMVNEARQRSNGLPHPAWGRLWDTEQHVDGVGLQKSNFANVGIEGEFAVTLGRDLVPGMDMNDLAQSIAEVFPVIELHNVVFHGDEPMGHELIANNAIHCGVVRAESVPLSDVASPTDLAVSLDEDKVDAWQGIAWPGDILKSVGWLVAKLASIDIPLKQGNMILTGALGPPLPLAEVTHVKVTSSQFGDVQAWFD
jgi:2-keto-4-pentenoate hydratase